MKKIVCGMLAAALMLCLCIGVSAQGLPRVVDEAGLLTQAERELLTEELERIQQQENVDLVVVTVQSLQGQSPQTYADNYYDQHGYGDDGALFLVDMELRQWYISTAGRCIHEIDVYDLEEDFISALSAGQYYDCFLTFAWSCEKAVSIPQDDGEMILTDSAMVTQGATGKTVLICLAIGLVIGLIAVLIMKAQLKSVKSQRTAGHYVTQDLQLTRTSDIFLYHTTTRRQKPQNNSTHTGSSGRSHGGGGGRF